MILGVDVARFGDDKSVIYPRRGRDANTMKIEVLDVTKPYANAGPDDTVEAGMPYQDRRRRRYLLYAPRL